MLTESLKPSFKCRTLENPKTKSVYCLKADQWINEKKCVICVLKDVNSGLHDFTLRVKIENLEKQVEP